MRLSRSSGRKYQSTLLSCVLRVLLLRTDVLCNNTTSESLYEGDGLSQAAHDAAALLASKVYYYLGEYDEALSFALGAGSAFEAESRVPGNEEYMETVICGYLDWPVLPFTELSLLRRAAKAIDRYVQARAPEQSGAEKIDPKLQNIIEGIFRTCIADGEYKQVRAHAR